MPSKEYMVKITLSRVLALPEDETEAGQVITQLLGSVDLNRFSTDKPEVQMFRRKANPPVPLRAVPPATEETADATVVPEGGESTP